LRNQERNTKISRTPPRLRVYRWDKHLRAKDCQEMEQEEKKGGKLNKKKRKEGVENLQLVEDHNLNLYRVRYSKHDLKKIIFKFDKELMP
jgi:mannose-6-phosphate isomerase class I